jgi:hypothetical protein
MLRLRIYQEIGIPLDMQRLYLKGRELQDEKSVTDFNIKEES